MCSLLSLRLRSGPAILPWPAVLLRPRQDFWRVLINADVLHVSTAPRKFEAQFATAWTMANRWRKKVAFWLSASGAGIEPLPGADDELAARTDDLPLI